MKYKDYIEMGFERVDINDSVELDQTGYGGFILTRELNDRIAIEVSSGELDKPNMYIQKRGTESCKHRIPITFECVQDLCKS